MPNHVQNTIFLRDCSDERRKEVMRAVQNDEIGIGSIDFEKIIPMPDNIYRGNLGEVELRLVGKNNWYDWSCVNWGTKWNAYEMHTNQHHIEFWTAWSGVPKVVEKLSKMFPDVTFFYEYADEDIGSNCGQLEYKNGVRTYEYYPDGETAVKFACEIWGIDESEYLSEMEF